jgi:acyl-CoA synthetase (AMP-forming)/AMP-acid ligase II
VYPGEHARANPDRVALDFVDLGLQLTYSEFESRVNQTAHLFRDMGLERGDHVAFLAENHPVLPLCNAAAERTGLIYTPINHHLAIDQVAYIVNDCQAQVVVTTAGQIDLAAGLPARCPGVRRWLMAGAAPAAQPYQDYGDAIAGLPVSPVDDERMGVAMLYSSGTTGRPKGVLRAYPDAHPGEPSGRYEFSQMLFRMREGMVYLSPAPLYHSAPHGGVSTTLRLGGTAVVMDRFDAGRFLELVGKHRVTHTQVVPTMFSRLLALPEDVRRAADISSLEHVIHAAAPCPVHVKERMIDWFGPIIEEYYSASEANGATTCDSVEWLARKGTVGRAILGQPHILDDEGRPCAPGQIGTIWFGGANNFVYFNDPEKTESSRDATGQLTSVGDVGYLDDDGYLFLTDRKSMMIISGGVNVYPQETENVLIAHECVEDVAIIGVPHADLGEQVKAVVQLVGGVSPSDELAAELIAYCRDRISHIACPRSVDFDPRLPRLPTGKLAKRLVRDRYWPAAGGMSAHSAR